MDILVSKLAYSKILLHLAKYPHLACNGLLLSKKTSGDNDNEMNEHLVFIDSIPLFHSSALGLASSIEIALYQVDMYCEKNDYEISGYYHANENINDNQPNAICFKIAEKLKEINPKSLVFLINNKEINSNKNEPMYRVLQINNDKLQEAKLKRNQVEVGTYEVCDELLKQRLYNELNDFDNHLDNINKNWLNAYLNELIIKQEKKERNNSK